VLLEVVELALRHFGAVAHHHHSGLRGLAMLPRLTRLMQPVTAAGEGRGSTLERHGLLPVVAVSTM
jgi:hypothetical protein